MKTLQKQLLWTLALAVGSTTVGVMQVSAQDGGRGQDQGSHRSYSERSGSPAYQQGMQQGQQDRNENRDRQYRGQYQNPNDRADYQAGYDQGYSGNNQNNRDARRSHGRQDRDAYDSRNGTYNHSDTQAQKVGYQDGINDGSADRRSGHSSRATQQQAYKHADHNYSVIYGDRQQYKNMYRQAYQQGYQQGYNAGVSYRR